MAERPVFFPCTTGTELVIERNFGFAWSPGFATTQKRKNIAALRAAAADAGYAPLLEISTKSDDALGQRLSAFNLKVDHSKQGRIPLECAFQASKVFERGGPYLDLLGAEARDAKWDVRLRESGKLIEFRFEHNTFPAESGTAFYDFLDLSAVAPQREVLESLRGYAGFTDIEFNPEKSLNCQARSCAVLVTLSGRGTLASVLGAPLKLLWSPRTCRDLGK